ncbi:hypothetical protein ACQKP0_09700 [Heyndrickxia sp. NPDC080065]|uniref:hypothetical protein n=1 Tax=Heyndrickxia sp. NPDC080065 TaxID=3390568 RepID=UPI003D08235F
MSFLLLFLIIFLVIFFFRKSNTSFPKRKKSRVKISNKISMILSIYIGVLLLSAILCAFIPQSKEVTFNKKNETENQWEYLDKLISAGKVDQINQSFVAEKWEKDYPHKQLKIEVNSDTLELSILVERKQTNDDKIEGLVFKPEMEMDNFNIEIGETFKPYQLEWMNDTVSFGSQKPINLTYSLFKKEFTITQFTGETSEDNHHGGSYRYPVLYLKVPKDLKIIHDEDKVNIEYIGQ